MAHLRELFNQAKENRVARKELRTFLLNKARTDNSLTLMERSRIRLSAYSPVVLDTVLDKVADEAEMRGEGEITPDELIDFLKRFFEEVWPSIQEAIKFIIGLF